MEKLIIRRDIINAIRNYPLLDVYVGSDEGMLGKLILPKHLYLIKYGNHLRLIFTRYPKDLLGNVDDLHIHKYEVLYQSYASHDIEKYLFPILNDKFPYCHYQNYILDELNNADDECSLKNKENFGSDFFEFANRSACNYVGRHFFRNSIQMLSNADVLNFGNDLLNMFSGLAFLSASSNEVNLESLLHDYNENFGIDLVDFALSQCREAYYKMDKRFQESRFILYLLDDDFKFLSSYRYL